MEAKTFAVFVLLAVLTLTLSGPTAAQQPGTPEPALARRAVERLKPTNSGFEGMVAPQQRAQNMALVGQIGGGAYPVAVAGNYAYVADGGGGLRIINVADPANPSEVGFYDTPGRAYSVVVAGNYAYVADWDGGLRIINVADPANPSEVGFYEMVEGARDVAVNGSYAYVANWDGGLVILGYLPYQRYLPLVLRNYP